MQTRPDLRILTYNVRGCRGTDGRLSPERIAAVIAAARPDVVALQELDAGRARSGGLDQAHDIARGLPGSSPTVLATTQGTPARAA